MEVTYWVGRFMIDFAPPFRDESRFQSRLIVCYVNRGMAWSSVGTVTD